MKDSGSIPMSDPLAFFLTWTTYGSWLPGDERSWVVKPGRFCEPDARREAAARRRMTESELTLTSEQRGIVENTVRKHCRIRGWHLHAVNCRTQHVHVVVTAPNSAPKDVMDQFKAWCTRHLKNHAASKPEAQAKDKSTKPDTRAIDEASKPEAQAKDAPLQTKVRNKWWTQGGSKRQLYDDASLEAAVHYVKESQDVPRDS